MSVVAWNGTTGNWTLATNWSTNAVPTNVDDAVVNAPGTYAVQVLATDSVAAQTVTVNAPAATVFVNGRLSIGTSFALNTGTLLLDGTLEGGTLALNGGSLLFDDGVIATLDGVLVQGAIDFGPNSATLVALPDAHFTGAGGSSPGFITLGGSFSELAIEGAQTLDALAISIGGSLGGDALAVDGVLTLGGAASVLLTANAVDASINGLGTLVNDGTITAATTAAGIAVIGAAEFENAGILALGAGANLSVQPSGTFTNSGQVQVGVNATLTVQNAGSFVNSGTITDAGGSLAFGEAVAGDGTIALGAGATASLAAIGTGQVIRFQGSGATLLLPDPASMQGTITGFAAGDTVDLAGVSGVTTAARGADNRLTLFTNTGSTTVQLGAGENLGGSMIVTSADGSGGTNLTLQAASLPALPAGVPGQVIQSALAALTPSGGMLAVSTSTDGAHFSSPVAGALNVAVVTAAAGATVIAPAGYAALFDAGASGVTLQDSGGGNQLLVGGPGADTLIATAGADTLVGGGGNTTFLAMSSATVVTGDGSAQVTTQLGLHNVVTGKGTAQVYLGSGHDVVSLNGASTVVASTGSDTVFAGAKALAFSGTGTMTFVAEAASTVVGGAGSLLAYGNSGSSVVFSGAGATEFVGGATGGLFVGGAGNALVYGGTGGDTIIGGGGTGTYVAGANSTVVAGSGPSTIFGASGAQIFLTGKADAVVVAGSGNELLIGAGSFGNAAFFAGSGNDLISGGGGHNLVVAGRGNSTVNAGSGADLLIIVKGAAGGRVQVNGFDSTQDRLSLQGYGVPVTQLLATATQSGGILSLVLPDGTALTFMGITNLPQAALV